MPMTIKNAWDLCRGPIFIRQDSNWLLVTILITGGKRPKRGFDRSTYLPFYPLPGFKITLMSPYLYIVLRCLSHNIN